MSVLSLSSQLKHSRITEGGGGQDEAEGETLKVYYYGDPINKLDKNNSFLSINFNSFGKKYIQSFDYFSQDGLQGKIASFLFNKLNFSIQSIYKINVIAL